MEIRIDGQRAIEDVIGQVDRWLNDWHENDDGTQYETVYLKDGRKAYIHYHHMDALAITYSLYRDHVSHVTIENPGE